MTDYAFRNLDQVKRVREAQAKIITWSEGTMLAVQANMPKVAKAAGFDPLDWAIAVETQRSQNDWETEIMAAERVARWVTLHAELHGRPPTARSIQAYQVPDQREPRRDRHSW